MRVCPGACAKCRLIEINFIPRFLYFVPISFTNLRNDSLSNGGGLAGPPKELGGMVYIKVEKEVTAQRNLKLTPPGGSTPIK